MIWALDDQVDARAASVVVRPHSADEVARGPARRATTRASRSPRPPGAAACAARACRCSAACCSTSPRSTGIVDVDTTSMLVDVLPGTFGDVFEDELRAEHGVTCGHWPQSMALSTVGGWLACRGAGQLSTRYGKIEDIVAGPRRRARRRHADHDRRRAARRGRARPHAAVRRLRRHARHHRRRPAARAPAARRPRSAPRTRSRRSPTGSTRCAGSSSAARRPRCCASTTRSKPTAATRPATRNVLLVLDEGDAHIVDATHAHRRRGVRGRRRRSTSRSSSSGSEHRNDVSALEALISRGFVVDTMEISASWRALPDDLRAHDRGDPRGRAHARRVRAPEPLVHRRRLPLLHVRGQAARGRARAVLPRGVGRRAARGARGRRRARATTTASA